MVSNFLHVMEHQASFLNIKLFASLGKPDMFARYETSSFRCYPFTMHLTSYRFFPFCAVKSANTNLLNMFKPKNFTVLGDDVREALFFNAFVIPKA